MSDLIKCTIDVDVDGTLKVKASRMITVQSYSKIEVQVPEDPSVPKPVTVTLPDNANEFEFLLVTSNRYGSDITFGDGTDSLELEGPLLLFGGAVASALNPPTITNSIVFENSDPTSPASIQIIIGLDVTS
jgi:hypothetical protein